MPARAACGQGQGRPWIVLRLKFRTCLSSLIGEFPQLEFHIDPSLLLGTRSVSETRFGSYLRGRPLCTLACMRPSGWNLVCPVALLTVDPI